MWSHVLKPLHIIQAQYSFDLSDAITLVGSRERLFDANRLKMLEPEEIGNHQGRPLRPLSGSGLEQEVPPAVDWFK